MVYGLKVHITYCSTQLCCGIVNFSCIWWSMKNTPSITTSVHSHTGEAQRRKLSKIVLWFLCVIWRQLFLQYMYESICHDDKPYPTSCICWSSFSSYKPKSHIQYNLFVMAYISFRIQVPNILCLMEFFNRGDANDCPRKSNIDGNVEKFKRIKILLVFWQTWST